MALDSLGRQRLGWRWPAAAALFLLAFVGLLSGVSLSERPDVGVSSLLTKAYYSLGLFVVGGLDIGTPSGGPWLGRTMLWFAYFGAPLLTASAVVEAVIRVMSPHRWQLKRLKNHIVIAGTSELTISYLRVLRKHAPKVPVVVVDEAIEAIREQELQQTFDVTVVVGDMTHDFLLHQLRLDTASRVVLMVADDFQAYETASKILTLFPHLASKILLHCENLRFLRVMQDTSVDKQCITFNAYHLAAAALVKDNLIRHFQKTNARDVVIMAGFGRFGQTILEELHAHAHDELETVGLIDVDADRRILVAEEQELIGSDYRREIFQGDISHPEVWNNLEESIDLRVREPTVILGTGSSEKNLRAALWIKHRHPNAQVFARTNDVSQLALEVGAEHDIRCFSIRQLIEDNLPENWVN